MVKILIIAEDMNVGKALETFLVGNGFTTVITPSIKEAKRQMSEINFNMILADTPKERMDFGFIPVLYLCSLPREGTFFTVFKEKTQDYLIKPFKREEFKEKVNNLLNISTQERFLRCGDLKIDVHKQLVLVKNKAIALGKKEMDILILLARKAGKVVAHEKILSTLEKGGMVSSEVFNHHMNELRKTLKEASGEALRINFYYGGGCKLEFE